MIAGESETGVTIMRMVKTLDAGGMFAKVTRPIGPDETSADVERDLAARGAALLMDVVNAIASGSAREEPQDDASSTYAAKITREEALIDWALSASAIHNRVRGLSPAPHAFTYLDGARLIVLKSRVESARTTAAPGTIVDVARDGIDVATGQGGRLRLLEIQPEGRRAMAVRDFIAGHPLSTGTRLATQ